MKRISAVHKPSPCKIITAGAVAGSAECLLFYPLDVLKTRKQLEPGRPIFQLGWQLIKDARRGLYGGMAATLALMANARAAKFFGYGTLKSHLTEAEFGPLK